MALAARSMDFERGAYQRRQVPAKGLIDDGRTITVGLVEKSQFAKFNYLNTAFLMLHA
jgi:hypothetical protein